MTSAVAPTAPRAPSWLRGVLLAAGAVWLAGRIVCVGLAAMLAGPASEQALHWNPRDAAALAHAAADRLASGRPADLEAADALARRALARSPLQAGAVRTLGLLAERRGQGERAAADLALAVQLDGRDVPARLWLFTHAALAGDYAVAAGHADAAARSDYDTWRALFPALVLMAAEPEATAPLARRLAARPYWRGPFLDALAADGQLDAATDLYAALERDGAPPTDAEAAPFLARLVKAGRVREARAAWEGLLPPAARAAATTPYDGGFRGLPGPAPFNWTYGDPDGGEAEAEDAGTMPGGRALHVSYDSSRPHRLVVQRLALAPGPWRLRWSARFDPAPAPGALGWSLRCDGVTAPALHPASSVAPDAELRAFQADFVVPAHGCDGQELSLDAAPSDPVRPVEGAIAAVALTPRTEGGRIGGGV